MRGQHPSYLPFNNAMTKIVFHGLKAPRRTSTAFADVRYRSFWDDSLQRLLFLLLPSILAPSECLASIFVCEPAPSHDICSQHAASVQLSLGANGCKARSLNANLILGTSHLTDMPYLLSRFKTNSLIGKDSKWSMSIIETFSSTVLSYLAHSKALML
jgi:hypothetical protein